MSPSDYSRKNKRRGLARPPLAWMGFLALLAPALVWLIISRSLVAYLVQSEPETALSLNSSDPSALVALAEKPILFDKNPSTNSLNEARGRLEEALSEFPLNARALRLLGQTLARTGDDAKATKAMQTAARYSSQELIAVDWTMRSSFRERDYRSAANYADVLLRVQADLYEFAAPILGRMAEDEVGKKEIVKLLAADPPWRWRFFSGLGITVTNARAPLELLLSLKETDAPPRPDELQAYIGFLFQHKYYKFAYFVWRQFLPPDQLANTGLLFNGGFETKPTGVLFDWKLEQADGAFVDIAPRPDSPDKNALSVEFGQGRVNFGGVWEMVILPPGAYRLTGSYEGNVTGPRGMQWSVLCLGGSAIGESQMILGTFPEETRFDFDFKVPPTGCEVQTVRLDLAARSSSEQLVAGLIRFAGLSIKRK
ncbi:MAG TPA: hypothetical protein VIE47_06000 [Methylocystis sp.]|jgi:hypothetical protein